MLETCTPCVVVIALDDEPELGVSPILAELASILARLEPDRPLATRMCDAVAELLDADGVGVILGYDSAARTTIAANDPVIEALQNLEDVLGEGPATDAAQGDTVVGLLATGTDADDRWPVFAPAVRQKLGAMSVLAVPIRSGQRVVGVLAAYSRSTRGIFGRGAGLTFLANAVGAAVAADSEITEAYNEAGPWTARAAIHQATGMVVAQVGLRPEDALALLRAHAYAMDRDLTAIASDVVSRNIDFSGFEVQGE